MHNSGASRGAESADGIEIMQHDRRKARGIFKALKHMRHALGWGMNIAA
jgi:hypothetical protein